MIPTRPALRVGGDLLRRAEGHDLAAAVAASGPKSTIQSAVFTTSRFISNDHHRVALVGQLMEHLKQLLGVSKCRPVVGSSRM